MKSILILLFVIISSGFLIAQTEEVIIPIVKNDMRLQDSQPIFFIVEEMPVFVYDNCNSTNGCFLSYFSDSISSIKFPSADCFGKIYIQFIIEPDSTVGDIKVIRGLEKCQELKMKIERIIQNMPKWKPGKQRGIAVRVMMTMPINIDPND